MKVQVLASVVDSERVAHHASSYLVGQDIAIDAGSIGLISSISRQRAIKHVFLSHAHADHIASLPMFLDNVYDQTPECPIVYGNASVREVLHDHVFNDRVWPDLFRLSREEAPFVEFRDLLAGVPVPVGDLSVTPIALNHAVPTFGFVVDGPGATIGIVSDTAPTDEIWSILRSRTNLKAVYLEAAFPDRMGWLAEKAFHLTPTLFRDELKKLARDVPVIAVHLKPAFHDEIAQELQAPGNVRIAVAGQVIDWSDPARDTKT